MRFRCSDSEKKKHENCRKSEERRGNWDYVRNLRKCVHTIYDEWRIDLATQRNVSANHTNCFDLLLLCAEIPGIGRRNDCSGQNMATLAQQQRYSNSISTDNLFHFMQLFCTGQKIISRCEGEKEMTRKKTKTRKMSKWNVSTTSIRIVIIFLLFHLLHLF